MIAVTRCDSKTRIGRLESLFIGGTVLGRASWCNGGANWFSRPRAGVVGYRANRRVPDFRWIWRMWEIGPSLGGHRHKSPVKGPSNWSQRLKTNAPSLDFQFTFWDRVYEFGSQVFEPKFRRDAASTFIRRLSVNCITTVKSRESFQPRCALFEWKFRYRWETDRWKTENWSELRGSAQNDRKFVELINSEGNVSGRDRLVPTRCLRFELKSAVAAAEQDFAVASMFYAYFYNNPIRSDAINNEVASNPLAREINLIGQSGPPCVKILENFERV